MKQSPKIGDVAQLVEQRTENPCVGGSIPSLTTFLFSYTHISLYLYINSYKLKILTLQYKNHNKTY